MKKVNWKAIWQILLAQLKGKFIKFALKKILGSALSGGFKGWLVKFLAEQLFDEIVIPLMNYMKREGLFLYDKKQGKLKVININKAKESNDKAMYIAAIYDLYE